MKEVGPRRAGPHASKRRGVRLFAVYNQPALPAQNLGVIAKTVKPFHIFGVRSGGVPGIERCQLLPEPQDPP